MTEAEFRAENIRVEKQENHLILGGRSITINYNLEDGLADIFRRGFAEPVFSGVFSETEIKGQRINNTGFSRCTDQIYLEEINDEFGPGVKVSVKNTGDNLSFWQNFYFYSKHDYIVLETVVESPDAVTTNYIAPVAAGTEVALGAGGSNKEVLSIGQADDPRFLFVPWDNDGFIRYRSDRLMGASESYGVTAIYDNTSRQGLVIGAVTHDVWKTGIRIRSGLGRGAAAPIAEFRVFGGIASAVTRDSEPHGSLIGYQVASPKIFLGFYSDWRDGLEEFGKACALVSPPLPWDHGPPFGWNSWSALAFDISYDLYKQASDFLKNDIPGFTNSNSRIYVNLDSRWGFTQEQYRSAVRHLRSNGHRAGNYGGFYSYWGDMEGQLNTIVEGTNGRYTYRQILLKDRRGRPLPPISGALSLDPTHPGTIQRAVAQIQGMIDLGFEYVKLDFMSHGAREGAFYNRNIRTGVQAYNYGMQKFIESIQEHIDNQKFFISLSIAPLFPSNFAHARRISCDVFGDIGWTEYLLNSLTHGWWQGGTIYAFNDPDHIALYNSYNHREPHSYNESLSGYVSRAIAGGLLIDSEDFRQSEARERARQILQNEEINKMASTGRSFRPVEGKAGEGAADTFVRFDADEGVMYLALFNFSKENSKTMTVSLDRIGLNARRTYRVRNLLTLSDEPSVSGGFLTVTLDPAQPKLFKLY